MNRYIKLALSIYVLSSSSAFADGYIGGGMYLPGAANIRDMAVPRDPGFVFELYNIFYQADEADGLHAGDTDLSVDTTVFATNPVFLWTTDKEVLGARYSAYIAPVYTHQDINSNTSSGNGNTFIQPLWLGWQADEYDISAGLGVYLPHGDSDVAMDFWTTQAQLAGYYYFMDQAGALMLSGTYEWHTKNNANGVTHGDHFSLEYGYSQYLSAKFEIGIKGYSQWQTESDKLPEGIQALNDKWGIKIGNRSRVHGIGFQAGYWLSQNWNLAINYMLEYGAKSRMEGDLVSLNLTYSGAAVY
ncbi:transporter [Vibrio hannami]|uniref:SphA family protein n=1 Tax=Vibrio hannami TaxID=2717094 RepID=UPI00240F1630|nr:transporter [Vibrio hannami]MDG3088546.1 transporter [Vibrio hannami]